MLRMTKLFVQATALAFGVMTLQGTASAQLFITEPDFKAGSIEGEDTLVGLALPGATPQEYAAHLIWNMRAGLNVAALQCQFSPFLRTVSNYNGLLANHSKELMNAYNLVGGYFKRKYGPRDGQKRFDDYSTITYNNFSTLQAQMGFCQTAADIAKEALARPKGQLYLTAKSRMRELRNSLVPVYDRIGISYNPGAIPIGPIPSFDKSCWDGKNKLKKKCRLTG